MSKPRYVLGADSSNIGASRNIDPLTGRSDTLLPRGKGRKGSACQKTVQKFRVKRKSNAKKRRKK